MKNYQEVDQAFIDELWMKVRDHKKLGDVMCMLFGAMRSRFEDDRFKEHAQLFFERLNDLIDRP